MPIINLDDPEEVTRSGATDQWTTLPTLPATCGPIEPGDKTWYVRFKIAPTDALSSLPAWLYLTVDAEYAPQETGTWVVDDVVQLGDSTAPSGANLATLTRETAATKTYIFDTAGILLADLNAGDVYIWLGWKAIPETPYDEGAFAVSLSGTGIESENGAETPWTGPPPYEVGARTESSVFVSEEGFLTASVSGPDVPYVVLDCTITLGGTAVGIDQPPPNETTVCSIVGYDGLGGTLNVSGHSPQDGENIETGSKLVELVTGAGSLDLVASVVSTTASAMAAAIVSAYVDFEAEAVQPPPSTLTLRSASLLYNRARPRGFAASEMDGVFGRIPDMAVRPL